MNPRGPIQLTVICLVVLIAPGCGRDFSSLEPAKAITDPVVFDDAFGLGVDYQAFLFSKLDAVSIDARAYAGTAALRVDVPAPGDDPNAGFAGGAFPTRVARDLSGYNALTFWARSSVPSRLDVAGLGNDNTGNSQFEASWSSIPLTTDWAKIIIPIPLPAKLAAERGLFFFAEAPETNFGHQVWFDEIRFESVGTIGNPRPSMNSQTLTAFVGSTVNVTGTRVIFDVAGQDQTIQHLPGYFTFLSSNSDVATVTDGVIRVVGDGMANVTASLDTVDVTGAVAVSTITPPAIPAPTPTVPGADVISLFSNAYNNVNVDTWSADWDRADLTDLKIAGNDVKAYTNLVFAGIEFASETINASSTTHFHIDVWLAEGVGFPEFKVKLVDFGADGVFSDDDSQHEIAFRLTSTPPIQVGTWVSLDIPMADFVGLTSVEHLAQLLLAGNTGIAYVDNVYFRK